MESDFRWRDALNIRPTEPTPSASSVEPTAEPSRVPPTLADRVRAIDAEFAVAVPRIPAEYVVSLSNAIAYLREVAGGYHDEDWGARAADVIEKHIRELSS